MKLFQKIKCHFQIIFKNIAKLPVVVLRKLISSHIIIPLTKKHFLPYETDYRPCEIFRY